MKYFTLVSLCLLLNQLAFAQDCSYNFDRGTISFIPKGFVQSPEQRKITEDKLENLLKCESKITDKSEKYWILANIASNAHILGDEEQTAIYAIKAFTLDTMQYCTSYIEAHTTYLEDDSFFEKSYLDSLDSPELNSIRVYCKEQLLEERLSAMAEQENKRKAELEGPNLNHSYLEALNKIMDRDQEKRSEQEIDWDIQNRLDGENRLALDSLYSLYGMPTKDKVTTDGVLNAFMVLHHSIDCEWNEKWAPRFVEHYEENKLQALMAFYLYRNYNPEDGGCKDNKEIVTILKALLGDERSAELFDFSQWEEMRK